MQNTATAEKTHFASLRNGIVECAHPLANVEMLEAAKKFAAQRNGKESFGEMITIRLVKITAAQAAAIDAAFATVAANVKAAHDAYDAAVAGSQGTWRDMRIQKAARLAREAALDIAWAPARTITL